MVIMIYLNFLNISENMFFLHKIAGSQKKTRKSDNIFFHNCIIFHAFTYVSAATDLNEVVKPLISTIFDRKN